jgi:hypothetical protein
LTNRSTLGKCIKYLIVLFCDFCCKGLVLLQLRMLLLM